MLGPENDGAGDDGTVFRDVLMLALLGFIMIVVLLLPHLNPPTQAVAAVAPPGNVIVEVHWPREIDADVDLWVRAPGDRPVGYSNKGARVFNLLRDDLGHANDADEVNHEIAFARGAPAGEYSVNLHLYANRSSRPSVPATVSVSVRRGANASLDRVIEREVKLQHQGQELTVARFTLDQNGALEPGSIHDIPTPLRTGPT